MVSNYPRPVASHDDADPASGLGMWMLGGIREAFCGLHGHDTLLQFEGDRIFLKCMSCGHESPGWKLDKANAAAEQMGERPQTSVPRPLITARRVA